MYAGGELAEEDMEAMMRAFQEAYWKAKEKNRKYVPKNTGAFQNPAANPDLQLSAVPHDME